MILHKCVHLILLYWNQATINHWDLLCSPPGDPVQGCSGMGAQQASGDGGDRSGATGGQ